MSTYHDMKVICKCGKEFSQGDVALYNTETGEVLCPECNQVLYTLPHCWEEEEANPDPGVCPGPYSDAVCDNCPDKLDCK